MPNNINSLKFIQTTISRINSAIHHNDGFSSKIASIYNTSDYPIEKFTKDASSFCKKKGNSYKNIVSHLVAIKGLSGSNKLDAELMLYQKAEEYIEKHPNSSRNGAMKSLRDFCSKNIDEAKLTSNEVQADGRIDYTAGPTKPVRGEGIWSKEGSSSFETPQEASALGRVLPTTTFPSYQSWMEESEKNNKFFQANKRSEELVSIDCALRLVESTRLTLETPNLIPPAETGKYRGMLLGNITHLIKTISEWEDKSGSKNPRKKAVEHLKAQAHNELSQLNKPALDSLEVWRNAWYSGFSDPSHHDNSNFQYIVNGLTMGNQDAQQTLLDPNRYNAHPGIISASLINHDKNTVWAYSGYIFDPSPKNIYSFKQADQAINAMGGREHLETLVGKNGLLSPKEGLEQSASNQHNELTMVGPNWAAKSKNDEHPPLRVAAIYIVEDPNVPGSVKRLPKIVRNSAGIPVKVDGHIVYKMEPVLPDSWVDSLHKTARDNKLPIVYIRQTDEAMVKEPVSWSDSEVFLSSKKDRSSYIDFEKLSPAQKDVIDNSSLFNKQAPTAALVHG